ncbi:MAG: chain length determinant protein EpsF [Gammaproteobacteria bacterium]|nr:chain length determinant protein EpsF [Gammaproteobacteria bacterium]
MSFQQFLQILRARYRLILVTLIVTVGTTAAVTYFLPNQYTASAVLVVDFKEPVTDATALPIQLAPSYMATQLDILQSRKVALKVIDNLKLADMPAVKEQFIDATGGQGSVREWLVDVLLKKLTVEPSRESRLMTIGYESTDPRFSAALANAFAQAYIDTTLELSVEPARKSAEWFEKQQAELRTKLEQAQRRLSAYQQNKSITAADERLDVETARLAELTSQLVVAQAQTYDAEGRQRQMEEMLAKGASMETVPEVLSNGFIQSLKAELQRQEAKLAELSEQLGVNHPQYQRAVVEVKNLRDKLSKEMTSITSGIKNNARLARSREEAIRGSLEAQRSKILKFKQSRDEIPTLTREVESAQRAYDAALERYNQSTLQSRVNQTNVVLLNPAAEPVEPSSPKVLLNMMLSVFLGTMLGLGLALLFEMLDRRVRTEQDLGEVMGLPVLGVLAKGTV